MGGGIAGIVAVAVVAVAYLTWPVSWWLMLTGIAARLLHEIHLGSGGKYRSAIAKDLRDAAMAVAGGIGFVAGMQLVLQIFGWMLRVETVQAWEDSLIAAKNSLRPRCRGDSCLE